MHDDVTAKKITYARKSKRARLPAISINRQEPEGEATRPMFEPIRGKKKGELLGWKIGMIRKAQRNRGAI